MGRTIGEQDRRSPKPPAVPWALLEGTIRSAPADLDDPVLVSVDSQDPTRLRGPCPWSPRGDELPSVGDRCLVARAQDTRALWVVQWWRA